METSTITGKEFNEKYPYAIFAIFSDDPELDVNSNDYEIYRIRCGLIKGHKYIHTVNIPDNSIVNICKTYRDIIIKSSKIIINPPINCEFFEIIGDLYALYCIEYDFCLLLEFVRYQTPEICLAAVQNWGSALYFVREQTPELCLVAVENDGWALEFVKEQTPEICLAAVKQDELALEFVKEQTPEICLAAVQKRGRALSFVKEQTPEICLVAVQKRGRELQFVKEQTPEICLAAVQNDKSALEFVKEEHVEYVNQHIEKNESH